MRSRFLHSWQQLTTLARGQNPGPIRMLLSGVILALVLLIALPIAIGLLLLQLVVMFVAGLFMLIRGKKPQPVTFYQNGYRREKVINPDVGQPE